MKNLFLTINMICQLYVSEKHETSRNKKYAFRHVFHESKLFLDSLYNGIYMNIVRHPPPLKKTITESYRTFIET